MTMTTTAPTNVTGLPAALETACETRVKNDGMPDRH